MTEDGLSGIVVRIGDRMAQLEVARFPLDDRRGPGLVVISDVNKHVHAQFLSTDSKYIISQQINIIAPNRGRKAPLAVLRWGQGAQAPQILPSPP